jgi:hypothetical protein
MLPSPDRRDFIAIVNHGDHLAFFRSGKRD